MSAHRPSRPLGVGLVGCGRAAGLHVAALARRPGLRVAAVADVDPGRRRALAARCGDPPTCASAEELAGLPGVEVVAVCVPPAEHLPAARAALAAGHHLLVEKPIALTAADADALVEETAARPVVATMGFNLRHHRQVVAARELVDAGALGRLQLLRTQWTAGPGSIAAAGAWRRRGTEGGGVLFELGSHHVDLWRHLLGEEVEVVDARARRDGDVETAAVVTARSAGGVLVSSVFSQDSSDSNELELVGEKGRLHLGLFRGDGPSWHPLGRSGGGVRARAGEAGRRLADLPRQARAAARGGDYLGSFAAEWHALERAISGERIALPGPADGRSALRLTLAARAAAEDAPPLPADAA